MRNVLFCLIAILLFGCDDCKHKKIIDKVSGQLYFALDNLYEYNVETNSWMTVAKNINVYEPEFAYTNKDFFVYFDFADNNIKFISLNDKILQPIKVNGIASNISISEDNKYIGYSLLEDEKYHILNLTTREENSVSLSNNILKKGRNISWSSNNKELLIGTTKGICRYSLADGKEIEYIKGKNPVYMSEENFIYVNIDEETIEICKYEKGQEVFLFSVPDLFSHPIVLPDKKIVCDVIHRVKFNSTCPEVRIYDVLEKEHVDLPKASNLSRKGGVVFWEP